MQHFVIILNKQNKHNIADEFFLLALMSRLSLFNSFFNQPGKES